MPLFPAMLLHVFVTFSKFSVFDIYMSNRVTLNHILEKWIDVSVLGFYYWADTNSRGFEPATLVAGPAALTC